jgi:hypothetical protein
MKDDVAIRILKKNGFKPKKITALSTTNDGVIHVSDKYTVIIGDSYYALYSGTANREHNGFVSSSFKLIIEALLENDKISNTDSWRSASI